MERILRTYLLFTTIILAAVIINAKPIYDSSDKFFRIYRIDPLEVDAAVDIPMLHNNNYDMIMPDYYERHPAESMRLQNFEKFYDSQMAVNNEYNMDESQFLHHTPVRAPQPLSEEERRIRRKLEPVDEKRNKRMLQKLKKGATQPQARDDSWEQFDYDLYSAKPSDDDESYILG